VRPSETHDVRVDVIAHLLHTFDRNRPKTALKQFQRYYAQHCRDWVDAWGGKAPGIPVKPRKSNPRIHSDRNRMSGFNPDDTTRQHDGYKKGLTHPPARPAGSLATAKRGSTDMRAPPQARIETRSLVRDVYQGKRFPRGTPFARALFLSTTAMRERGWTNELIDAWLGPPHETRVNPYIAGGDDMKLWLKTAVIAAEDDAQFVNRPRRSRRTEDTTNE
jgi:hypothetical protein